MKKYYLMAIKKENIIAMYNLAYYYEDKEKNYELKRLGFFDTIVFKIGCASFCEAQEPKAIFVTNGTGLVLKMLSQSSNFLHAVSK